VSKTYDVAIVGGGILGWSAAYRLVRHGQRVLVIDRNDLGQATAAGAGIISPGTSIRMPKPSLPLSKAAVAYYPSLVAELAEDGECNTGFASPGTIFVFLDETEYARMPEIKALAEDLKADGFRSIGEISVLDGKGAKEAFPTLADIPGALHMSEGARVDGRLMRDALRRASLSRGVTEVVGSAEIGRQNDKVTTVQVGSDSYGIDAVLIAGGAWTPELGAALGAQIPVTPQRGQILHFAVPDVDTSGWSIIHGFHNHYLLGFPTNRVVAGATREDGTGYDYRMTAGGVFQELGEALRVAPGLGTATLAEIRVGFRPSSADTLPVLGRLPGIPNAWVATGHGPSGLQLGPVSAAAVSDLMVGVTPALPLDAYSPGRFIQAN
jgi:D-amino-acid dehydrogenase